MVWEPAASLDILDPLGDTVGTLSGTYAELDRLASELASARAAEAVAVASDAGFEATPVVRRGRPREVILEEAERIGAGTIVVGARGLGRIEAVLIGSVSSHVVRHARRPVLVVPPTR